MSDTEALKRRPRGSSPRGSFEVSKLFATVSEEARVDANKRKTEALRAARQMNAKVDKGNPHGQRKAPGISETDD